MAGDYDINTTGNYWKFTYAPYNWPYYTEPYLPYCPHCAPRCPNCGAILPQMSQPFWQIDTNGTQIDCNTTTTNEQGCSCDG